MLDATAGPSPGDPYAAPYHAKPFLDEVGRVPGRLKVAVSRTPLFDQPVHRDCLSALDEAAALIAGLGHHVDEAEPMYDRSALAQSWWDIVAANEARDLIEGPLLTGRQPTDEDFEPWTRNVMDRGNSLSGADVIGAIRTLH
jgi:Asp-tRNA(Asn)/Glu-tRNA(Gln) amidotransferase A subunit family amidase